MDRKPRYHAARKLTPEEKLSRRIDRDAEARARPDPGPLQPTVTMRSTAHVPGSIAFGMLGGAVVRR